MPRLPSRVSRVPLCFAFDLGIGLAFRGCYRFSLARELCSFLGFQTGQLLLGSSSLVAFRLGQTLGLAIKGAYLPCFAGCLAGCLAFCKFRIIRRGLCTRGLKLGLLRLCSRTAAFL